MPVEHSPQRGARTRSRTRQALEQGQGPPLLGVVNNPVAPTPPPAQQDRRGDPPPSPEPNIRQDLREQEPVVPELQNEQQLGDPLQNQPDLPLNDPLQNQPDLPLNDPLQNQPDLPLNNPLQNQPDLPLNNMAARFPPAMQSWEAFTQALIAIRPPLPEYSGLDYEDPDRYLTKCQEYVTALQLPEGSRLAVLEKGLKGAAEKWWQCYKPMNLSFDRFSELLRAQFNSQSIKGALVARLYGTAQTDKENTGTFLQQKYMMYQRLRPTEDEA
ncbi:unnamed protein product, partial [Trichogramma brassicae]